MKKYITFALPIITAICLTIGFSLYDNNDTGVLQNGIKKQDNRISKLINEKKSRAFFSEVKLFNKSSRTSLSRLDEFVNKADIFELNRQSLNGLISTAPECIVLMIESYNYGLFELELTKMNFAPRHMQLKVINGNNVTYRDFNPGLSYGGIIKGDNNSVASISINENFVTGLICNDKGNFVLGAKKDEYNRYSDDYIFYNDRDLKNKNNFKCDVDDYAPIHQKGLDLRQAIQNKNVMQSAAERDSIRVYFEADYQMYLDNGSSVTQTGQFITSAFTHVAMIYHNESIETRISDIYVHPVPDPYGPLTDSYSILNLFGQNTQDNFNGDLAHLLSTGHNQQLGGIAWINILCQPYLYFPPPDDAHYGRFAFSNIEPNFLPYPLYSWTVEVITHEMGHNVASKHTHACVWPTSSGVIDSCYDSEGGCVPFTFANYDGTIMSYCHLNGAINLVNGFGPLPGDTIRLGYELAHCIDQPLNSSEPVQFVLMQNYPNPYNPGTSIRFALPQDGYVTVKVYDINGREVAGLIQNKFYSAGVYSSYFNASDYSLSSGVYLYRLDVRKIDNTVFSDVKKMVLVK